MRSLMLCDAPRKANDESKYIRTPEGWERVEKDAFTHSASQWPRALRRALRPSWKGLPGPLCEMYKSNERLRQNVHWSSRRCEYGEVAIGNSRLSGPAEGMDAAVTAWCSFSACRGRRRVTLSDLSDARLLVPHPLPSPPFTSIIIWTTNTLTITTPRIDRKMELTRHAPVGCGSPFSSSFSPFVFTRPFRRHLPFKAEFQP